MTEKEKNIIEEFINNTDYFNIDNKYCELVEAVKNLYNSYNRKQIVIEALLKEIKLYGEQHTGDHIPRID